MKSLITSNHNASIRQAVFWTAMYFLLLLFTTFIDIVLWRKIAVNLSVWLNLALLIVSNTLFLSTLVRKTDFTMNLFSNVSIKGIMIAIGCAILFYNVLDKGLDPVFERLFPSSEIEYQETIRTLKQSPMSSFLHVCLIAPFIEEILMRGYILEGIQKKHGVMVALIISSILFAGLHFNMVQTLSALICGVVLGLLYLNTGSLFCCILTHFLYNTISYFSMIYPIK